MLGTSVGSSKLNREHTNVPCVKERKDGGNSKKVIELRKTHLDGFCLVEGPGGLAGVVVCWMTGLCSERPEALYITANLSHMRVSPCPDMKTT
jgi:hypothetical protein